MAQNSKKEPTRVRRESERYYIDGNTARRLELEPEPRRRQRQQEEVQPEIRHEKRVSAFDLKYTLFLIVSVGVMLGSCFMYMRSATELTTAKQSVAEMQSDLEDIQEKNRLLEDSLNTTIDLEEIYKIATERFGMVYADEDQVIYYDSSNSEYVRQYGTIPD